MEMSLFSGTTLLHRGYGFHPRRPWSLPWKKKIATEMTRNASTPSDYNI
jgi:hypothetical protein